MKDKHPKIINGGRGEAHELKLPFLSTGGCFVTFAIRQSALQVSASQAMLSTQQTVHGGDRPTWFMHAAPASYLSPTLIKTAGFEVTLNDESAELPVKQQLKCTNCGGGCQVVAS